jgi:hypothetical protein
MLIALLVILFAVTVVGVFSTQFAGQVYASASQEEVLGTYQRGGYSLDDIRAMLQDDDAIGFKRVYNPYTGPTTYYFPIEEVFENFETLSRSADGVQPFNNFNYQVRPIVGAGRACNQSIVLVF